MFIESCIERLKSFTHDVRGSFLPMAGVIMPVTMLAAGGALEYSRLVSIKGQMQASTDSALVSVSLKAQTLDPDMDEGERNDILRQEFQTHYSTNFSSLMYDDASFQLADSDFDLEFDTQKNKATVEVNFAYDTAVLSAFGRSNEKVEVDGSTILAVTPENYVIDIVMCIDATGSMQSTLDAVKVQAQSFNADLRSELGIEEDSGNFKIRVKPIFYRDWDDEYYYNRNFRGLPRWYKRYFRRLGSNYEGGLIEHDFIDLDPQSSTGVTSAQQTAVFSNFIGSEVAAGGYDWPEGAGACLNEGIRADWYDNKSAEARAYFNVPDGYEVIELGETPTSNEFAKISTIPVIVFWTDAPFSSLSSSQQYLSSTTPTSYSAFEALWENPNVINQQRKLLIEFGPTSGTGWNTVKHWDGFTYGGSLSSGNSQGVERIADEIKKAIPELLRLSS